MNRPEFEILVAQALDSLPEFIQEKMTNVEVLIEPAPTRQALVKAGVPTGHTLLGLYQGIPLTERTHNYSIVPPDTITLYQRPIERAAGDPDQVRGVIKRTVMHEVAHHFGISDDRLRELGAY
ncbi:MAG: metallopeptidase family protein [Candidatus Promineifilaceae bacterium]|jgi:predicted Zn-dependent protease with MMP-like domain